MVGVSIIALLAFFMAKNNSAETAIPVLGAVALGAQRILPAVNQVYTSWSSVHATKKSMVVTLDLLNQKGGQSGTHCNLGKQEFYGDIEFSSVSFRYEENMEYVLKDLTVNLPKNAIVGIKGTTGSGKSTFVDLVMGLLEPSEGLVIVNGHTLNNQNLNQWQKQIAHVPQNIFLTDDTITKNIALGLDEKEIEKNLIIEVAKKAQIYRFIKNLPRGFETKVGERGIRLSGGQRQRIGIARALYQNKKILIFDEATSALDNSTESEIISAIHSMESDTTILMVAHRLSTLEKCTHIIDMDKDTFDVEEVMPFTRNE